MRGITVMGILLVYILVLLASSTLAGIFMGKKVNKPPVAISRTV